jgi:hypothetical protein
MWDVLSKMNGGEVIALVAVIGGLLIAAIAIVAGQWRRVRVAELEAALKQQMLDKGMPVAEIEQVLKASRKCGHHEEKATGDAAADKAKLVKRMADNGYSGEDIERVLHAFALPVEHEKAGAEKAAAVLKMVENGMEAHDIERVLKAFPAQAEQRVPDSERIMS